MNNLGAIRKSLGLTQKAVSQKVNIAQASYCNIENGKKKPSVSTAKKIAAVFGIPWPQLFD